MSDGTVVFGDLIDEFLMALVLDHPVVVYVLPTVLVGAKLVLAAESVPYLALVIGVVLSLGLSVAYAQTNLYRESSGERSTADWVAVGVFLLVIGGAIVAEEVDRQSRRHWRSRRSRRRCVADPVRRPHGTARRGVDRGVAAPGDTGAILNAVEGGLLQVRRVVARAVLFVLAGVALVVEQEATVLTLVPRYPVALRGFDHART